MDIAPLALFLPVEPSEQVPPLRPTCRPVVAAAAHGCTQIWYSSKKRLWCPWKVGTMLVLFSLWLKDPYCPADEVSIWLVDAKLLSRFASRRRNARRSWRGNAPPPSRRDGPAAPGLSYSWPMAYR